MTKKAWFKWVLAGCSSLSLMACSTAQAPTGALTVVHNNPVEKQNSYLAIAQDLAASGDHEAAVPLFRHIANSRGSMTAIAGLAESLIALGDAPAAYAMLSRYRENNAYQPSTDILYAHGKSALMVGHFSSALASFDRGSRLSPSENRFKSGQAVALAALGETQNALEALSTVSDANGRSNKALILSGSGQHENAVAILESMVANGEATARDRQNLAMAYLLAGRREEALKTARLDLDAASVQATFQFYHALEGLPQKERFQALMTGSIDPDWTRQEDGNLILIESKNNNIAAARIINEVKPKIIVNPAPAKAPTLSQAEQEETERQNYKPGDVPPVLESTGWALQIGAYRTTGRLTRGWALLLDRNRDILGDIPPRRSEMDFGERDNGPSGFYYRLNAGPLQSYAEAKSICDALIDRGTLCWIRPPEASEGSVPTATAEVQTDPKS